MSEVVDTPAAAACVTPALWGVEPSGTLAGSARSGVAAVRMQVAGRLREVSGPTMPAVHILSWVICGEREHRVWNDGRLVHHGPIPHRTVNIVPAGIAPKAVVAKAVDVLHLYIPHLLVHQQARMLGFSGSAGCIELIDPRSIKDPVVGGLADALLAEMQGAECRTQRLFADEIARAVSVHVLRRYSNLAGTNLFESGPNQGGLAAWQVKRVSEYLQSDLKADPGLSELASLIGLSAEHFCRAFKASTGLPPHAWLVARRVERARELLETTSLAIEEIAAQVGYAEPSHLARMFRRAHGLSPTQYRRERLS